MRLARDDDVVEALAPNRSDQPFGKTVLPRRRWCDGLVPNAHSVQSACNDGAIDAILIADEVARRFNPRNASVIWRTIHSAVGFVVTLIQARALRSSRMMMKA